MALNGVAPVLIIKIYKDGLKWKPGEKEGKEPGTDITLDEWAELTEYEKDLWHTPFPMVFYLSEIGLNELFGGTESILGLGRIPGLKLGIAADNAEQSISCDTVNVGPKTYQVDLKSNVTLKLRATKNNIIMTGLLSFLKQAAYYLNTQRYSITLYYDDVFVLDGLFGGIGQQTVENSNVNVLILNIVEKHKIIKGEQPKVGKLTDTSGDKVAPGGGK